MTDPAVRALLESLPMAALIVDSGLSVRGFSRRALPVFGLRARAPGDDPEAQLSRLLIANPEIGDPLALATAQLVHPGDEERFTWHHRDRSYGVTVTPMGDEGELLVLFDDVTQRALSEEIHENARAYLEQILDDIPIGVIVLNRELRITFVNRRQLRFLERMGQSVSLVEAIGATLQSLLPDDPGASWHQLCAGVLERGERAGAPPRPHPVVEGELALATGATPLRHPQGSISGVILVSEDVTEQQRLARELLRVEKLATVGQMVITINHEINNPLSIISTSAQSLRLLNPDLADKVVDKLLKIEAQVRRITEVTERLRRMDEVVTSEYIDSGPRMVDVWGADRPGEERT